MRPYLLLFGWLNRQILLYPTPSSFGGITQVTFEQGKTKQWICSNKHLTLYAERSKNMQIEDCYELGHITSTHGTGGEVVVYLDVDDKEEYSGLESVFMERKKGQLVPYFIERFRFNKSKALVKFEDIDTMEAAEMLKNCRLYLPLDQLPELSLIHI